MSRRAASYISNAALNYHEPYASSASELVTELLQYIADPTDLMRAEAEALLAGIVLGFGDEGRMGRAQVLGDDAADLSMAVRGENTLAGQGAHGVALAGEG